MNFKDKKGTTAYYSANVVSEDADIVEGILKEVKISPINTRVFKTGDKEYEVRIAAAEYKVLKEFEKDGVKCKIITGDYAPFMKEMVTAMSEA